VTGRLARDLRTAWRGLLRSPGLAAAAVACLALGIGANLTAFALLRAIEFPILPYPDATKLVQIDAVNEARQAPGYPLSLPDYEDVRARSSAFADLGVSVDRTVTLEDGAEPARLSIKAASPSYFTTLGVGAETGRAFTTADLDGGSRTLVVLSHRVWTERYGRNTDVLGRSFGSIEPLSRSSASCRRASRKTSTRGFQSPEARFPPATIAATSWSDGSVQARASIVRERSSMEWPAPSHRNIRPPTKTGR
jgi:hypothetical protein